ncbi:MAG: hypothetical protein FJY65_00315 [Calditrichaeota bacterium]|nr:hypothetical protein [Calditrichota bacterium]
MPKPLKTGYDALSRDAALIFALGAFIWSQTAGVDAVNGVLRAGVVYIAASIGAIVMKSSLLKILETPAAEPGGNLSGAGLSPEGSSAPKPTKSAVGSTAVLNTGR